MPLEDYYPYSLVFIVAPQTEGGGVATNRPVGTGFLVSVEDDADGFLHHNYVVTASHVVSDGGPTWARVKKGKDDFVDVDVPEWHHHTKADVAIAPFSGLGTAQGVVTVSVEAERFVGSGHGLGWEPELGEDVYFLGLFATLNITMVRSGCVGALYVPDVPIGPPANRRHVTAHLIDCRSYAGFSGSPCFVQKSVTRPPTWDYTGGDRVDTETALFGIVSGHFDMWGAARLTGDIPIDPGAVEVPLNSGVGVVTPAIAIKELLDMDELREDRKRVSKEYERHAAKDSGATLDSTGETEFARFENLTRKLVNTPKPDISEKRKGES